MGRDRAHSVVADLSSPQTLLFHTIRVANLKVVVGTNDLTSPARLERSVTSIIYPKAFDKYNLDNDIALLLLSSPITFSDLIVPICLPTLTSPSKWHECWVAGWGQTKTGMPQFGVSWELLGHALLDMKEKAWGLKGSEKESQENMGEERYRFEQIPVILACPEACCRPLVRLRKS